MGAAGDQVFVAGSYSSALANETEPVWPTPPATSTRPSGRSGAEPNVLRGVLMLAAGDQVLAAASWSTTAGRPFRACAKEAAVPTVTTSATATEPASLVSGAKLKREGKKKCLGLISILL